MICENQKVKKVTPIRIGLTVLLFLFCSCTRQNVTQEITDLPQIREKENLVVAVSRNSVDYFVDKGEPAGFQYEILSELSRYLGIKVEIFVGKSFTENLQCLSEGRCDMIASGLLLPEIDLPVTGTDPLYTEQQVLIQRKPANRKKMSNEDIDRGLIRNPEDLNGKMVYASGWSSLPDNEDFVADRRIRFVKLKGIEPEDLIDLVAEGELDYAICSRSVACLISVNHENIDIRTELGELPVGWLVRSKSSELLQAVNQWLAEFSKTTEYAVLHNKYRNGQTNAKYPVNRTGTISKYDELFKKYSKEIGWDWRLLASLVCQESRFQPEARSKRGAYGLMQMMPATMERFSGTDIIVSSPEKQIAAGVAYIKYLDKLIAPNVSDKDERIKFVLASYNIGPGHILDAQRLAEKYGKDASVWDNNVDSCLLSKADPKYYTDPEVRHGKCKGKETYAFVSLVLERFEHYKNINKIQ